MSLARTLRPLARPSAGAPSPAGSPDLPRLGQRAPAQHGCDMCGDPLADAHRHVVDASARRLLCCCTACALLFSSEGAGQGRYLPVPDSYRRLSAPPLTAATFDPLGIPVGTAFFFFDTAAGKLLACYPSPAGATESLLDISAWSSLLAEHPDLAGLAPDTQALLVHRDADRFAGFLVPIDACYELVGLVRRHWKGLDGGEEAHQAIGEFFAAIEQRCAAGGR